ncbi:TIGR03085 family metal-binding protein [Pseudonocardia asaccharolytica]|uniref:TIGR03085 family protein n=1 Tax=Pseudonocardia asaccharolytica DSM 44247 = NBRC 16224 TaxID=1123024 RepID=A0A511D9N1_9PSEU|nr:TIGR03085 family metal-binding protein [Pseudonocardia asaccharolytica]GEL20344.1 TIGR03085 family protein [Pseudonocardia asaccharolytica DSM 44247 = NBRC 16224]
MSLATTERAAICDEFERSGPDRPTLCAGWTTRDLLAHLLVRERQPWATPGIVLSAFAPVTERAMQGYADTPWQSMIDELREGPPPWSPYRVGKIDELVNGAEFFVHHEDVRRGEPGWEPREPDADRDAELWALLGRIGRMLLRRVPVAVLLRRPDGEQQVVRTGRGLVTVVGEPAELVLHAFGRSAARVELLGSAADLDAYRGARRGV